MARRSKAEKQQDIVDAIVGFAKSCEEETNLIRNAWRDNHGIFENGTVFEDKADYQANFSINKLGAAIRTTHSKLKRILINNPDWFDLEPVNTEAEEAAQLANPLKKLLVYHLDRACFLRYASTFILNSLISMGSMFVGWKAHKVRNPEWVAWQADKMLEEERRGRAKVNALEAPEPLDVNGVEDSILNALAEFKALAQDSAMPSKPEPPEWLFIGGLDLQVPIAENCGWDTNVAYLADSEVQYYRTTVRLHQLQQWAKEGKVDKKAVKELGGSSRLRDEAQTQNLAYKGKSTNLTREKGPSPEVDLIVWWGPIVSRSDSSGMWEVEHNSTFAIVANESVLLKSGPNPFWEPKQQKGPLIMAASREVPHKAVGSTPVTDAKDIQRAFDSNNTLIVDAARYGVTGINIVNVHSLVEKTLLEEGIEPGSMVPVKDDPRTVWRHENLTSNIENQTLPVQNELRSGINESIGVSSVDVAGTNNLRSRTSATEVQSMQQGSQTTIDQIAVDLEINFLAPFLEKALARILQFGLKELQSNPEIANVLTEREIEILSRLSEADKVDILFNFYRFKIKGFSFQADHQERLQRFNEAFQVANSGGPLAQIFPWAPALKRWFKEMEMDELSEQVDPNTEISQLNRENQMLIFENRPVGVSPNDNHEVHMQSHQAAAMGSGGMTPALQQHLQQHQQAMMMIQQQQQQAQLQQQGQGQLPAPGPNNPIQ